MPLPGVPSRARIVTAWIARRAVPHYGRKSRRRGTARPPGKSSLSVGADTGRPRAVEEEGGGGGGGFFESEPMLADELDGGGDQATEQLLEDLGREVVAQDALFDSAGEDGLEGGADHALGL